MDGKQRRQITFDQIEDADILSALNDLPWGAGNRTMLKWMRSGMLLERGEIEVPEQRVSADIDLASVSDVLEARLRAVLSEYKFSNAGDGAQSNNDDDDDWLDDFGAGLMIEESEE